MEWGLRALALECMSVSRVAAALGISWHTANNAILTSAQATLLDDPHRFDGVEVLGVDEHVWRHTRRGDRYVTVIIDLTPVRDRSGPARLLDVVPGRSKKVLKTWLSQRDQDWRGRVEVVAMDGFTGFKSAAGEELPQARAVMDPFHVVSLAGDKLDQCRRRVQRAITGRRGRAGDRLYRARRTLLTGAGLLTDAQVGRLETLFADDRHAAVQAAWGRLPAPHPGLPRRRPGPGKVPDATAHRLLEAGRPRRAGGDPDPGQNPDQPQPGRPGLLRPPPYLQRPHAKPSTDAWSTYAASPWDLRNLTSYTIRSLIHAGRLKDHLAATT